MKRIGRVAALALMATAAACGAVRPGGGPAPARVVYGHSAVVVNFIRPGRIHYDGLVTCLAPGEAERSRELTRAMTLAAYPYEVDRELVVAQTAQQSLAAMGDTMPAIVVFRLAYFPDDRRLVVASRRQDLPTETPEHTPFYRMRFAFEKWQTTDCTAEWTRVVPVR